MFPYVSGSEGSKEFPAIWRCCSRKPTVSPNAPSLIKVYILKGGVVQGNLGSPELGDYISIYVLCENIILVDITLFFLLSIIYNLISSHLLGTKFIPIKIRIVRLRITHVHTKSITLFHNLCNVTHHRHSM